MNISCACHLVHTCESFFSILTQQQNFLFNFARCYQTVSLNGCINLYSHQEVLSYCCFPFMSIFPIDLFKINYSYERNIFVVLICLSLITNRIEPFVRCLWAIFILFYDIPACVFCHFSIGLFFFDSQHFKKVYFETQK